MSLADDPPGQGQLDPDFEHARQLIQQFSIKYPTSASFLDDFIHRRYEGAPVRDEYPAPNEMLWEEFIQEYVNQAANAVNRMLNTFPPLAQKAQSDISSWTEGESAPVTNLNQFFFHVYNALHAPAGTADMIGLAQLAASIRTFDRPLCALWTTTCNHYDNAKNKERLEAVLEAVHRGEPVPGHAVTNLQLHDEAFNLTDSRSWGDLRTLIQIMQLLCKSANFALPSCDDNPAWATFLHDCHNGLMN